MAGVVQEARATAAAAAGDGEVPRPQKQRARVLVFPLPFQGHMDPMLHLAGVLHGRGLAVTVLHTRFNAPDPARHPEFRFVAVPDNTPPDVAATGRIIDIILAMNAAIESSSSSAVAEALASAAAGEQRQPRASCLFIDANLLAVQRAARSVGLPTLVLRTGSAACLRCFLAYPVLHDRGYLSPPPPQSPSRLRSAPVPELPPLRVRDLFYSRHSDHALVRRVLARATETVRACSGLVINTCDALEAAEIGMLRHDLAADQLPVVLAAGPLHKLASSSSSSRSGGDGTGSSLLAADRSCIEWLDGQRAGSVLYVSSGSLAAMDAGEFLEVACGLAESGHPFLWVIRPNQVVVPGRRDDTDTDTAAGDEGALRLPDGGAEEAVREGRGAVVRWAPQREVLAHGAVGGFWTHCGWNSTLEAVGEGVPMMCTPDAVDQMMNARYVQEVWGVGFELEREELERGRIRDAIRKLMSGREGDEMRRRAQELRAKVAAACCLDDDDSSAAGSSQIAVDKLVQYILSL